MPLNYWKITQFKIHIANTEGGDEDNSLRGVRNWIIFLRVFVRQARVGAAFSFLGKNINLAIEIANAREDRLKKTQQYWQQQPPMLDVDLMIAMESPLSASNLELLHFQLSSFVSPIRGCLPHKAYSHIT